MIDIIGSIVVIIMGLAAAPIFPGFVILLVAEAVECFSKAQLNRFKARYLNEVCTKLGVKV